MKNLLTFLFLLIFCDVNSQQKDPNNLELNHNNIVKSFTINSFIPEGFFKPDISTIVLLKNTRSIARSSTENLERLSKLLLKYSMIMNVDVQSLNNTSLYHFIDQWFGTPYRFGGSSKKGIDCSSFTASLLENIYSLILPKQAKQQFYQTIRLNKEELKEGDLVFFNTRGGISHVGVFLSKGNFVHSSSSKGVTINNLSEPYFARRYVGAGRVITKI